MTQTRDDVAFMARAYVWRTELHQAYRREHKNPRSAMWTAVHWLKPRLDGQHRAPQDFRESNVIDLSDRSGFRRDEILGAAWRLFSEGDLEGERDD